MLKSEWPWGNFLRGLFYEMLYIMNGKKIEEQLISKVCWRAWDGILPAIFFEIGGKKDERTGEYSLCFDTCPWQIIENDKVIGNSKDSADKIIKILLKFVGQKVTGFEFNENESTVSITFDELRIIAYLNDENDTFYIVGNDTEEVVYSRKLPANQ